MVLVGSEQAPGATNAGVRATRYDILGLARQFNLSKPLNVTEVITVFYIGVVIMTAYLFPLPSSGAQSPFYASLGSNYSSISISYPLEPSSNA
jgi:hypothetical protein